MFIIGSRLPSQWLGGQVGQSAESLEEGNPLDRSIYFALILLAICVLTSRSFKWGRFFASNFALMAFVLFALVSVCWSDFPFVGFKRWFRDLGNYLVILVVLSDPHPLEAVRAVLRRVSYLLVPLSILLIKYYPQLGKQYTIWTGAGMYVGAATSKNMLGALCLISGLFFFWDTATRWSERKQQRTRRILLVNVAFIAMTLWLLNLSSSATSGVCLSIGCLVIAASHTKSLMRRPILLKVMIPACFCLYVLLAFGFDMNGRFAGAVGRDPTLTDRTEIWKCVLALHTNPLVGTGYQTFWLGHRLEMIWQNYGPINEAHNGFLQIYLDLGLIGILFLVGFLVAGYRTLTKRFQPSFGLRSLALAVWTVLLFYNMTEAAFEGGLLWMMLLMGAVTLPARAENRARFAAALDNSGATELSSTHLCAATCVQTTESVR